MHRQSLGSPGSKLHNHGVGVAVKEENLIVEDQNRKDQVSSLINDDEDNKSQKPHKSTSKPERFVHSIPLLVIVCFLVLYLSSHDPSQIDLTGSDDFEQVLEVKKGDVLAIRSQNNENHKTELKKPEQQGSSSAIECSLQKIVDKTHELKLTQLTHLLLLEISPSNSSKLATLLSGEARDDQVPNGSGLDVERVDSCGEDCGKKKKKKKRAKKKRANSKAEEGCEEGFVGKEGLEVKEKQELVCLYPFTSSSSVTQRKIKQQYDQLVKSHESNGAISLTKLQTTRPDSVQRAPNPVKPSSDRRTPSTNSSRDQEEDNEVSTD